MGSGKGVVIVGLGWAKAVVSEAVVMVMAVGATVKAGEAKVEALVEVARAEQEMKEGMMSKVGLVGCPLAKRLVLPYSAGGGVLI